MRPDHTSRPRTPFFATTERERHNLLHAVAAVHVHVEADRPERVRRIGIAPVTHFRTRRTQSLLLPTSVAEMIRRLPVCEVVDVTALRVCERSQKPLVAEIPCEHLHLAVTAILKHHAVATRLFAGFDNLPCLIKHLRTGHLCEHVLACEERINLHLGMERSWRSDVHQIHVVAIGQPFHLSAVR